MCAKDVLNQYYIVEFCSLEVQIILEAKKSRVRDVDAGNACSSCKIDFGEVKTYRSKKVKKFSMKMNGTTLKSILRINDFSLMLGKAALYEPVEPCSTS